MEKIIILQGITVEQLLSQIDNVIEKKIKEFLDKKEPEKAFRYLSRKQVAKSLHITLPTLHYWTKMGLLKSYKIGNRVLFRNDEIDESLHERKFLRI